DLHEVHARVLASTRNPKCLLSPTSSVPPDGGEWLVDMKHRCLQWPNNHRLCTVDLLWIKPKLLARGHPKVAQNNGVQSGVPATPIGSPQRPVRPALVGCRGGAQL